MFVVVLTYVKPVAEVDRHMRAHMKFVNEQYAAQTFIASGRQVPRTGGLTTQVVQDHGPGRMVYDPGHPDADAEGNVRYPDIDVMHEMVDMMTTSRSYEANANVLDATRQLAMRALEIGR